MRLIPALAALGSAAVLAIAPPGAFAAQTQTAPAAGHYTTADTNLGTLLDDPAAKAVLMKYIPTLLASPQIDQGRGMTLKAAQQYVPDQLSDKVLADIDADLAKLPSKS